MEENYGLIYAGLVIAGGAAVSFFSRLLLGWAGRRLAQRTTTTLDDRLIKALRGPVQTAILLAALYWAVRLPEFLKGQLAWINPMLGIAATMLAGVAAVRVVLNLMQWYAEQQALKSGSAIENQILPLLKKLSAVFIYSITLIIILDRLNIKITALLASLGVASLAVALALQDTLSNLFSGFYIAADRPVKVGDYVKLDTGDEGFVENIGWRTSRIRMLANNLIIIPNNKLASSIIINFEKPTSDMGLVIPCGVAYGSDLEKVEKTAMEVAGEVLGTVAGGVPDFKPFVRFNAFGDSNITFSVILRVKTFTDRYLITHEFIKALDRRFRRDNIEISFPVRRIITAK
jgi:small-conductance mechanosensitive channel